MKRKILLSALLSGGALLASCGGGGGGDTSFTTTGDITPSSYATLVGQVADATTQSASISTQSYQIGDYVLRYISAVTIDNGQVLVVSDEIDNDGKFQLTLLKDKDYVFTIFDNDGQPVVSTIGKTFQIMDNDFVTIELADTDNDGTPDSLDVVPTNEENIIVIEDPEIVDNDGDNLPDIVESVDTDNDGIPDIDEYLSDQDNDGILDSAEDTDNDSIPDIIQDHDGNGVLDIHEDEDNDGIRDVFDYIHNDDDYQFTDDHVNNGNGHGRGNGNHGSTDNNQNVGGIDQAIDYVMTLPYEDLTEAEEAGIIFMREEEKLARDVYSVLKEEYGNDTMTFTNITESEQRHMDLVKALIDKYQLEDPVAQTNDQIGVFVNEELQNLYNELVSRGEQSLEEALKVGALIEEVDIVDLKERLEQEDNQDIKFVYENLMKGSRNHLRAFVKALQQLGVTYEPQVLSQEEYEEIINSDMERGDNLDNDMVIVGGSIKEDIISTSALTKRYVVAYRIDVDNDLPSVSPVEIDNTFVLKLKKGAEYTLGVIDEQGNPIAFTEGEDFAFLSNNAVTLLLTDVDNDGKADEILVDPLNKDTVIEKSLESLKDSDNNGVPDALEEDHDHDGKPDYMKALEDKDGDGIPDLVKGRNGHNGNNQDKDNGHQQDDKGMNDTDKGNHGNDQRNENTQQGNNQDQNHQNMNDQQENHNQGDENSHQGERGNQGQNYQNDQNQEHGNDNAMNNENDQNHENNQGQQNNHQETENNQQHQEQQGNGQNNKNYGQDNQSGQGGQENHSENGENHGQGKQNGRGNQDRQNTGF